MPLLTNSRLAVWRRCKREHYYRYVLCLSGRPSGAQNLGTVVHTGLEAWYRGHAPEQVRAAMDAAGPLDSYEMARAVAMLAGYQIVYAGEQYTTVAVEQEFRAPLPWPRGWDLAGKLDVVVRQGCRLLVQEHKTSAEDLASGSSYWRRLRVDSQCSLYLRGAVSIGYDVEGVVYDVLGKPGLKPQKAAEQIRYTKGRTAVCLLCKGKQGLHVCRQCGGSGRVQVEPPRPYAGQRLTDETPAEYGGRVAAAIVEDPGRYYKRVEVVRLGAEAAEFESELIEAACEIEAQGQRPPARTGASGRACASCSYTGVCYGEKSAEEYVRLSWPHPELKRGDSDGND